MLVIDLLMHYCFIFDNYIFQHRNIQRMTSGSTVTSFTFTFLCKQYKLKFFFKILNIFRFNKDNTKFLYYPSPVFYICPSLKKPALVQYYKLHTLFTCFSINVLFCSRIEFRIPHYIQTNGFKSENASA